MQRAQKRAAVTEQKFWFRKHVYPMGNPPDHRHTTPTASPPPSSPVLSAFPNGTGPHPDGVHANGTAGGAPPKTFCSPDQSRCPSPFSASSAVGVEEEYEEMTINEIINGNVSGPPMYRSLAG